MLPRLPIPCEDEKIPRNCQVIRMPNDWVASAMADQIERWCPTQPVLISAPTGRGKTSFVADLVRFCHRNIPGGKVLLLENRTAIATQQKRVLTTALGSKWAGVQDIQALELTDKFPDIGLTVLTYQALAAQYQNMDLNKFSYVVFDEAHYFLADSSFNFHLDRIFWKLPELFSHAHRIYMTATPGTVLPTICEAESTNLEKCSAHWSRLQMQYWTNPWMDYPCIEGGKLLLYDFPRNFDRVNLHYYRQVGEIVSLVHAHPNEKFLVFASRREDPTDGDTKSYVQLLKAAGISVDYLDRFSKSSEVWKKVCREGRFDAQVLECTSVLDCGVSFHDSALKHIVVETTDKTEFLQEIGRKRLGAGEELNVYIRALGKGKLYARHKQTEDQLSFISEAERKIRQGKTEQLIFGAWCDEDSQRLYARLLDYEGHGRVSRKETAYRYLRWQRGTLNRLLRYADEWGDDSALPRLAHEWLEQPDSYDETHWLDFDQKSEAKEALVELLENHLATPITEERWNEFSKAVKSLCGELTSEQHDSERDLKHQALSNRLSTIGLPYNITKSKKTYTVKKMEEML